MVHGRAEIPLDLLAVHTVVDVQNERLILPHGPEDLQEALLPGVVRFLLLERAARVLQTRPLHKIVNVLEVVVKRHAVDAAVLGNVVDGDLRERLFEQQIFERLLERPLCYL